MKKFLSLFVAVLMLVSAFSMNVFAATNVIGTHGTHADGPDSVSDGIDTFDPDSTSKGIVNVDVGTVGHRYAVDVTFADMTLDIGNVVWDVNSHTYVSDGAAPSQQTFNITIDNHSDLPIYVKGAVSEESWVSTAAIDVTVDHDTNMEIGKATIGGSAEQGILVVTADSTNWPTTVSKVMEKQVNPADPQPIQIATVTVTISSKNA